MNEPNMDTTETLIEQIKAGDQTAFGELYDRFAEKIFRFIKIKVQDQGQAEDILQDVFVKAWQGIPNLHTKDLQFSAWLYTVARNTMNDYFRKKYRRPEFVEFNDEVDVQSSESVEHRISAQQDGKLIQSALKELPAQYAQVVELRFLQQMSVTETAQILGKTGLAIRVLQHRALKRLQEVIKEQYALEY